MHQKRRLRIRRSEIRVRGGGLGVGGAEEEAAGQKAGRRRGHEKGHTRKGWRAGRSRCGGGKKVQMWWWWVEDVGVVVVERSR